jgi:hypothetical protein
MIQLVPLPFLTSSVFGWLIQRLYHVQIRFNGITQQAIRPGSFQALKELKELGTKIHQFVRSFNAEA